MRWRCLHKYPPISEYYNFFLKNLGLFLNKIWEGWRAKIRSGFAAVLLSGVGLLTPPTKTYIKIFYFCWRLFLIQKDISSIVIYYIWFCIFETKSKCITFSQHYEEKIWFDSIKSDKKIWASRTNIKFQIWSPYLILMFKTNLCAKKP